IGLMYDIVAILNTILLRVIPSYGWFSDVITSVDLSWKMTLFLNYFSRVGQGMTNTFICVNRATAILFPLQHNHIWGTRGVLPACFTFQFIIAICIGIRSYQFNVHYLRYPQGQLFAVV
ncbi:hypothetical protein PFISCL1PPCAC_14732, partial [Pristionchus fissidentatus]